MATSFNLDDSIDTIYVYYKDSKGALVQGEELDEVKYNGKTIWSSGNYAVTASSMTSYGSVWLRVHTNKQKEITVRYNAAYKRNKTSGQDLLETSGSEDIKKEDFEYSSNPEFSGMHYSKSFEAFKGLSGYLILTPRISVKRNGVVKREVVSEKTFQVGVGIESPSHTKSFVYDGKTHYGASEPGIIPTKQGGDGKATYYDMSEGYVDVGSYTTICTLPDNFQNFYWLDKVGLDKAPDDCRGQISREFTITAASFSSLSVSSYKCSGDDKDGYKATFDIILKTSITTINSNTFIRILSCSYNGVSVNPVQTSSGEHFSGGESTFSFEISGLKKRHDTKPTMRVQVACSNFTTATYNL